MSQPEGDPAEPVRQPGERVPVLDVKRGLFRLYADPRVITHGKASIELDRIEWVSYWSTVVAEKRFMFPTFYHREWDFAAGRYPRRGGQKVSVHFTRPGRGEDMPDEWAFLVNLARQYVEPRLLADMVSRVQNGETVTVAGNVNVGRGGIACGKPRLSLRWASMTTRVQNGMVCVYQAGVEKPALSVPLSYSNAGLMPALFTALRS